MRFLDSQDQIFATLSLGTFLFEEAFIIAGLLFQVSAIFVEIKHRRNESKAVQLLEKKKSQPPGYFFKLRSKVAFCLSVVAGVFIAIGVIYSIIIEFLRG